MTLCFLTGIVFIYSFVYMVLYVSSGKPIKVEVGLWVTALDSISVLDMV